MTYTFISWNIDSINAALTGTSDRATLSLAVVKKLAQMNPDILAIQETKLQADGPSMKHLEVIQELFSEYNLVFRSSEPPARKGYSGTLFLYKNTLPQPIVTYPTIKAPDTMDSEGRILTLEFPEFFVTTVYTPNAGDELKRLDLRGEWDDAYRTYLSELDKQKPVIASGDFNVAFKEIDLANPSSNHNSPGFTDQEREKFGLLLDSGFTDTFRHIHGEVESVYSWFAQRSKTSKINNTGWRIDYYLTSNRIADQVKKSEMIDSGSRQDHVPLLLEIDI
ncbi:MAG: exodeoxyribonuclease III [Streptococcaceae bacterium]|nr:exodeoxyribonuclease III [Streptococcaceae bacterium]